MYKENITSLNQANRQIAILLNQNALLADRNHELEQKTQDLQRQLDWFKRQLFGQKSEKILPGPDEVPCLPGFEGSPKEAPQAKGTETVREHERKKREVNGWGKTISGLRKCPKLLSIQNEVRFGGAPIAVMCRAFDRLMRL